MQTNKQTNNKQTNNSNKQTQQADKALTALVQQSAYDHQVPTFQHHMTLGTIQNKTLEESQQLTTLLAQQIDGPIETTLNMLSATPDAFFRWIKINDCLIEIELNPSSHLSISSLSQRCIFVTVNSNAQLEQARAHHARIIGGGKYPYVDHISLLYSNIDEKQRQEYIKKLNPEVVKDVPIKFDRLLLVDVRSGEEYTKWKVVQTVVLKSAVPNKQ